MIEKEPSTRIPLSAVQMSVGTGLGRRYVFGMNKEAAANLLRTLADDIESDVCLLQGGCITSKVQKDDYAYTWISIRVSETLVK